MLAGSVAFIGHSIRTNEEGIRQMSRFLRKMEYEMRVIELPETILHLDKVLMVVVRENCCTAADLFQNEISLVIMELTCIAEKR